MKVKFTENNSDHSGPVIEIISENDGDAFELGILFQKTTKCKCLRMAIIYRWHNIKTPIGHDG
jgi:hypothetical protein